MAPSSSADRLPSEQTRRRPWSRIFGRHPHSEKGQLDESPTDGNKIADGSNEEISPSAGRNGIETAGLTTIPSELFLSIITSLDATDIRSLRLTSKQLSTLITPIIFHKTKLSVDTPANAYYCIKHFWYGSTTGDRLPCNGKRDYIFKTHSRCPFYEYKSANRKAPFPLLFTLGPLLDVTTETWKVGLPRMIPYVEELTLDITTKFRERHYIKGGVAGERVLNEIVEEFETNALPLIFPPETNSNIKSIRINVTTLPPAQSVARVLGRICDSAVVMKTDIHVKVEVENNNKLPLLLSGLHGLSSLAVDIRQEWVPDLSNLPTWVSPENIVSMRRTLGRNVWEVVERSPKMKVPENLGEIIEAMKYYEVLQGGGRKPPLFIGPK